MSYILTCIFLMVVQAERLYHMVPARCLYTTCSIGTRARSDRSPGPGTCHMERWGAGVETPKNVRGEIGGWGRVPFNETYAPSLSTIYDGA